MSLNKGYAAKLHREARNEGPSVGASLGNSRGGGLMYLPKDDGCTRFDFVLPQPHVLLDANASSVVFDGNLGHAVWELSGERFSVVICTCPRRK